MTSAADDATPGAVAFLDDEGRTIVLDGDEANSLFAATGDLDAATVSACPGCRSRVLACLALVDLIDLSAPHARGAELVDFADDAPSSHCYVRDLASECRHWHWLDPGRAEWEEALAPVPPPPMRPRR